jgi:SAM-dependent methyltransferase
MDTKALHEVKLPEGYIPVPGAHLANARDCEHYLHTLQIMFQNNYNSILDVGCFDGWHPLLLARDEFEVVGVEFISDLCNAGKRYAEYHKLPNIKFIEGTIIEAETILLPKLEKFDLVTCYEVLEHIPLSEVPRHLAKMEELGKTVSISLPDQKKEDNIQHQWTPDKDLIYDIFGGKNPDIIYKTYPTAPQVPGNWFITYHVR